MHQDSRRKFIKTINHQQPDKLVVDFGSTGVTGIHVLMVGKLRDYYGFEKKPVKVTEPYQMLGEVEEDLREAIGIDVIGISPPNNMFGHPQKDWKPFRTFWGQDVLVPGQFNTTMDENGDLLMHPSGDLSVPHSAKMPKSSYFFDAVSRQQAIDDSRLNPEDNLEEFTLLSDTDLKYWKDVSDSALKTGKGIIANFGGTAVGDIALVPAIFLKNPKGIRDVTEWYMSLAMRPDYLHEVFDKQTDIAVQNLRKIYDTVGSNLDAVFICGTDFGTQDSTFCSVDSFYELYVPYYKKMNNWIHENTTWKTFKHSCGAVETFMQGFIDAGFDIINPVQINAKGMDSAKLKEKYGDKLVFWGGGIDTQIVLAFSSPVEIKEHVKRQIEVFSKGGGFVFNTVHNIQANVPVENVVAMIETVKSFSG